MGTPLAFRLDAVKVLFFPLYDEFVGMPHWFVSRFSLLRLLGFRYLTGLVEMVGTRRSLEGMHRQRPGSSNAGRLPQNRTVPLGSAR